MNNELIAKAKTAKSPEELLALANENEIELTEEQAKGFFDRFNVSRELEDDELEGVAGGCGGNNNADPSVCPYCKHKFPAIREIYEPQFANLKYYKHLEYTCRACGKSWDVKKFGEEPPILKKI